MLFCMKWNPCHNTQDAGGPSSSNDLSNGYILEKEHPICCESSNKESVPALSILTQDQCVLSTLPDCVQESELILNEYSNGPAGLWT